MLRFVFVAACVGAAVAAEAQVGYTPERSPYRDLERRHEVSIISGHYRAETDPAGVAPRSGPLVGVRYQWLAGGPVNLTADVLRVESERRVLDPDLPATCTGKPAADCKMVSRYRWPLYFVDAGMSVNLTGSRTWKRLVPEARGSIGLASDFHTSPDIGDFQFGTKFNFGFGAGVRWVPRPQYQVRFDIGTRVYTVSYPDTYFTLAPDTTRVLPFGTRKKQWLNNPQFSLGVSYLLGR